MTVQAQLIYQPISGQYAEKHFEVPKEDFKTQSWTWALFTGSNGTSWAASFRGGETSNRQLELLNDTSFAFVVSDGQGYFVNVESEELIKCTFQDDIIEVAMNADRTLILFADRWNILAVDNTLVVKELAMPFKYYNIWFKQLLGDILEIEYQEMYTHEFKATYLDLKDLKFITI